jgi:hypothetical protein
LCGYSTRTTLAIFIIAAPPIFTEATATTCTSSHDHGNIVNEYSTGATTTTTATCIIVFRVTTRGANTT